MFKVFENLLPSWLALRPLHVQIQSLPESVLIEKYLEAGEIFAIDVIDVPGLGETVDFKEKLNRWAKLEREYARRGYKTIGTFVFASALGGDGARDLFMEKCVGKKRNNGEGPIFHAQIYRDNFLGKPSVRDGGEYPHTERIAYNSRLVV